MTLSMLYSALCDVHARIDALATNNGIIRGYTKNLVIRLTLVINFTCKSFMLKKVLDK